MKRRPLMVWLPGLLGLIVLAMPRYGLAGNGPRAAMTQLIADVGGRLEMALRADGACVVDRSRARLRYLVATDGAGAKNALITVRGFSDKPSELADGGMLSCWILHPLMGEAVFGQQRAVKADDNGPWIDATVVIGADLIEDVCLKQPTRLAVIIGHELGHLSLGHVTRSGKRRGDALELADLDREQEFAADEAGVRYALAAGYGDAASAATDLWQLMKTLYGNDTPLEPASAFRAHPTQSERIANFQTDPNRKRLWRALVTYDNGVSYLQLGDWLAAQGCFESAQSQFPGSPEVLTNLGYAKMMQYYAALPAAVRWRIGGEISCLAFVTTRPAIRGGTDTDKAPLQQAISHFRQALVLGPAFTVAQANLGTALVMDPDASPEQLGEASALLASAAQAAEMAGGEAVRADAVANLALAQARIASRSDADAPRKCFIEAYGRLPDADRNLALALNLGASLADADTETDWNRGETLLSQYLRQTPDESYYHRVAARQWAVVRHKLGKDSSDVPRQARSDWIPAKSLSLNNGKAVLYLQQSWSRAQQALVPYRTTIVPVPGAPESFVCDCPDLGLQLRVFRGTLRVIVLTSMAAPTVTLRSARVAQGRVLRLKVGEEPRTVTDEATQTAGERELGTIADPLKIGSSSFSLYRQTGVAVNWSGQRIAGIALISG